MGGSDQLVHETTLSKAVGVARDAVDRLRAAAGGSSDREMRDMVVRIAVAVAAADRVIDAAEDELLCETLRRISALPGDGQTVQEEINAGIKAVQEDGAAALGRALGGKLAGLGATEHGLRLAAAVAFASHGLSRQERSTIVAMAEGGGVAADRCEAILAEVERAVAAA